MAPHNRCIVIERYMHNAPIKRPHWSSFIMKIFLNIANVGLKNFPPTMMIGTPIGRAKQSCPILGVSPRDHNRGDAADITFIMRNWVMAHVSDVGYFRKMKNMRG